MEAIGQLTAEITATSPSCSPSSSCRTVDCARADPGHARLRPAAQDIEHAGRRASEMIRQLMLFAGHASEGAMVPLDLVGVANRVAETCRSTFDQGASPSWSRRPTRSRGR